MRKIFPILLLGGLVGVVVFWPKICGPLGNLIKYDACSIGQQLSDLFYKGTKEGPTFGEQGFVDSGIVNPGSTPITKTTVNTPVTPAAPGVKTKHKSVIAGGRVVAPPAAAPATTTEQATCKVVNGKLMGVDSNGNVIGDCKSGLGAYSRSDFSGYTYSYLAQLSNRRLSYN